MTEPEVKNHFIDYKITDYDEILLVINTFHPYSIRLNVSNLTKEEKLLLVEKELRMLTSDCNYNYNIIFHDGNIYVTN